MQKIEPSIILVRPQLPENIGLVARAMQNCGLNKLIVVNPKKKWPNQKTIDAAANAEEIIEKTIVFDTLNKALSNKTFVIATSSRKRLLQKPHKMDFVSLFKNIPINKKIAIVFGPENSGLTNEDLMLCDCIFSIPLSTQNKSLNLSHSVLLMAYKWKEFFKSFKIQKSDLKILSDKNQFDLFMSFLKAELTESGFLFPKEKSRSMFNNIQTIFLRAQLSKKEIQTIWGMIKTLKYPRKR